MPSKQPPEPAKEAGVTSQDLADVARLSWRVADRGVRLYVGGLRRGERLMLSLLKQRMELLELPPPGAPHGADVSSDAPGTAEAMEELLARSLEQTTTGGRSELFARIVRELVPDEARILACVSATATPLVHVETLSGRRVLENATMLGRTAALSLPQMTGGYVSNLLRLGLVEVAPECPELKVEYEILLADRVVREALKQGVGPVPARALRRSLRLSAIGRELWEAAKPTGVS
jgi:hypothetical protein